MTNQNTPAKEQGSIDLVKMTNYTPDQIALMKNTVAKGTTDLEFAQFANVCKNTKLDPFTKEIWCIPMGQGNRRNVLMFASRDGYRKTAQQNPNFVSVNGSDVREKDEFKMGTKDGKFYVEHSFKGKNTERGGIIGAYAVVNLKDGGIVIEWADFAEYNQGRNVWTSHSSEMIKKVAEMHALKKICNLSGIYAEEEFNIKDGKILSQKNTTETQDNASKLLNKTTEDKKPEKEEVEPEVEEVVEGEVVEPEETITKANADALIRTMEFVGSKRDAVEKHYGKEIYKFSPAEALDLTKKLKEKKEAIEIQKAEKKEAPKEETKAAKSMREGMEKGKTEEKSGDEITGVPEDVCVYLNSIDGVEEDKLETDILMLKLDANRGVFKGYEAYPNLKKELNKTGNDDIEIIEPEDINR